MSDQSRPVEHHLRRAGEHLAPVDAVRRELQRLAQLHLEHRPVIPVSPPPPDATGGSQ